MRDGGVTADGAGDVRIELEVVALVELDEEALGRAGQVSADRRLGRHRGVGNRHHVPVRAPRSQRTALRLGGGELLRSAYQSLK